VAFCFVDLAQVEEMKPKFKSFGALDTYLMACELSIARETKRLPRAADPADFAQDMRLVCLSKYGQVPADLLTLAIHRWAMNWCRSFVRRHKEIATDTAVLVQMAGATRDSEDLRDAEREARKLTEVFPEIAFEYLVKEGSTWNPIARDAPTRPQLIAYEAARNAIQEATQPESKGPTFHRHKDGTTSYLLDGYWQTTQPSPFTAHCPLCRKRVFRGQAALFRMGRIAHPKCCLSDS